MPFSGVVPGRPSAAPAALELSVPPVEFGRDGGARAFCTGHRTPPAAAEGAAEVPSAGAGAAPSAARKSRVPLLLMPLGALLVETTATVPFKPTGWTRDRMSGWRAAPVEAGAGAGPAPMPPAQVAFTSPEPKATPRRACTQPPLLTPSLRAFAAAVAAAAAAATSAFLATSFLATAFEHALLFSFFPLSFFPSFSLRLLPPRLSFRRRSCSSCSRSVTVQSSSGFPSEPSESPSPFVKP